ncbi:RNA polymerase sigma factor [Aestuariivirga litoralis]|uniref:RNA polymerase sigma factor n=1 Tax=Aestuariivirga litoralis TaxID=2650924 RepID=UPI001AEE0036|nr:sigma-70 family RNA polymerase sigma factor [Aestuariivirga litoralis]
MAIRPVTQGASSGPGDHWLSASDGDLLAASGGRNEQAFAVLLQRYYKDVYRVVWRLTSGHADTEDVTQEAFLRLWSNPGQVREAKALKGWLLRVASNLVMDRFRRKPTEELEAADEVPDGRESAETTHDVSYVSRCMDAAITDLPDRQKIALTLVHFEQMSNIEAAATMEISVDALESLLARARRGLKDKLGAKGRMLLGVLENR